MTQPQMPHILKKTIRIHLIYIYPWFFFVVLKSNWHWHIDFNKIFDIDLSMNLRSFVFSVKVSFLFPWYPTFPTLKLVLSLLTFQSFLHIEFQYCWHFMWIHFCFMPPIWLVDCVNLVWNKILNVFSQLNTNKQIKLEHFVQIFSV